MGPTGTPPRRRRPKLKPGMCFKATRLECEREEGKIVRVKAEEIHTVVDHNDPFQEPCINPDVRCFQRDPSTYEMRKIFTSSSFKIRPPLQHLKVEETENGTQIVDVEDRPLETKYFPPMRMVSGVGYRETNVAKVIFGLDPSDWGLWVTPVAFQLIKRVRDQVIKAGGIFIADFNTSESGWAVFQTMYICPSPSKSLYVQACRVESPLIECCGPGSGRIFPPLRSCGGRVFNDCFTPTRSGEFDPILFKPIERILDEPPTPGTVIADSPSQEVGTMFCT
ncbi:unnamed protein product [Scytosiphon promiscuus]